jgi:phosphomannomutase
MIELEESFPDANTDRTDGLKLVWPDRWIHVRASNTEPLLRFSVEAKSEEAMDSAYKQVEDLLR